MSGRLLLSEFVMWRKYNCNIFHEFEGGGITSRLYGLLCSKQSSQYIRYSDSMDISSSGVQTLHPPVYATLAVSNAPT